MLGLLEREKRGKDRHVDTADERGRGGKWGGDGTVDDVK
jgi:hypothetical protein